MKSSNQLQERKDISSLSKPELEKFKETLKEIFYSYYEREALIKKLAPLAAKVSDKDWLEMLIWLRDSIVEKIKNTPTQFSDDPTTSDTLSDGITHDLFSGLLIKTKELDRLTLTTVLQIFDIFPTIIPNKLINEAIDSLFELLQPNKVYGYTTTSYNSGGYASYHHQIVYKEIINTLRELLVTYSPNKLGQLAEDLIDHTHKTFSALEGELMESKSYNFKSHYNWDN